MSLHRAYSCAINLCRGTTSNLKFLLSASCLITHSKPILQEEENEDFQPLKTLFYFQKHGRLIRSQVCNNTQQTSLFLSFCVPLKYLLSHRATPVAGKTSKREKLAEKKINPQKLWMKNEDFCFIMLFLSYFQHRIFLNNWCDCRSLVIAFSTSCCEGGRCHHFLIVARFFLFLDLYFRMIFMSTWQEIKN